MKFIQSKTGSVLMMASASIAAVFVWLVMEAMMPPTYAQSQPQIPARTFGRYITDITGSNTTFTAVKTHSNLNTAMVIDSWRYDDCWVQFQGKADGNASASNLTLVFIPVDENDATPSSGLDITTRGQHVNVICSPGSNAAATVWAWASLPTSNGLSYKLWMTTNAGANWTNCVIKAIGRARVQN